MPLLLHWQSTSPAISPVNKDAEAVCQETTPVAERANMLYSGCFVSAGNGQMLVTGVENNTEFGQIAQELSSIEKTTTPLQEKLDKLGKQITVLGASAAAIVFAIEVIQFVMNGQLNLMLQHFKNFLGTVVFETVPLSVGMWGKMLLTAFTVIILNEGVKAVKRLFRRK